MLQKLNLRPLEERRKHQRLILLHKIVEGEIPALPPDKFLTPAEENKRKIKLVKPFGNAVNENILQKYSYNNSRGFKVPTTRTEQYERSFFVQTVADWNKLEEVVVQAGSVAAFSAALSGAAVEAAV